MTRVKSHMEIRETKDDPRNEGPLPRFGLYRVADVSKQVLGFFGDYWTLEEAVAAMQKVESAIRSRCRPSEGSRYLARGFNGRRYRHRPRRHHDHDSGRRGYRASHDRHHDVALQRVLDRCPATSSHEVIRHRTTWFVTEPVEPEEPGSMRDAVYRRIVKGEK